MDCAAELTLDIYSEYLYLIEDTYLIYDLIEKKDRKYIFEQTEADYCLLDEYLEFDDE